MSEAPRTRQQKVQYSNSKKKMGHHNPIMFYILYLTSNVSPLTGSLCDSVSVFGFSWGLRTGENWNRKSRPPALSDPRSFAMGISIYCSSLSLLTRVQNQELKLVKNLSLSALLLLVCLRLALFCSYLILRNKNIFNPFAHAPDWKFLLNSIYSTFLMKEDDIFLSCLLNS